MCILRKRYTNVCTCSIVVSSIKRLQICSSFIVTLFFFLEQVSFVRRRHRLGRRRRNVCLTSAIMACFTHFYTYDLDLWPLTLKTFSAMRIHVMNISCGKFDWNLSTKHGYRVSRQLVLTDNGRTAGRTTGRHIAFAVYCWRHKYKKLR